MRVVTPQITWHNRDPVLCLDFDPSSGIQNCIENESNTGFYRLATGGSDSHVLVWHLKDPTSVKVDIICVADLTRHTKAVNALRFSPCGKFLASADDDAYVYIWRNDLDKLKPNEEFWMVEKALRKHIDDVSDMSWSADSGRLVTTSVDNSAIVWDVKKGTSIHILSEHIGFVQGVSCDPSGDLIATVSTDRLLRIFNSQTGKLVSKALKYPSKWLPRQKKIVSPDGASSTCVSPDGKHQTSQPKKSTPPPSNRLFEDDTLKSFCRRLNFSPKGEFLVVPGGILPPRRDDPNPNDKLSNDIEETKNSKKMNNAKEKQVSDKNAVTLFCRHSFTNPCAVIPLGTSYSIATRFCPTYFHRNRDVIVYDKELANPTKKSERMITCVGKLRSVKKGKTSLLNMPYRLVYAVGTNDSLIISDTDSAVPLAVVRNIHLTRLSDLSWSADGRVLITSSTDGYCSVISFEENELGIPMTDEIIPPTPHAFSIPPPIVKEKTPKVGKKKSEKNEGSTTNTPKTKDQTTTPKSANSTSKKKDQSTKTPTRVIPKFFQGSFKHKIKMEANKMDSIKKINDDDDDDVIIIETPTNSLKSELKSECTEIQNSEIHLNKDVTITLVPKVGEDVKEANGSDVELEKDKITVTPKRNTFLERWLKKPPGNTEMPAPSSMTKAVLTVTKIDTNSKASLPPPLQPMDVSLNFSVPDSTNFNGSPTVVLRPLISPEQIHQLQNAPIIVDLEADEAENAASVILSSEDKRLSITKLKSIESPKGINGPLETTVTPTTCRQIPIVPSMTPIVREKRPATSPLSSHQKPKQPRRVEFITLPKSPRKDE